MRAAVRIGSGAFGATTIVAFRKSMAWPVLTTASATTRLKTRGDIYGRLIASHAHPYLDQPRQAAASRRPASLRLHDYGDQYRRGCACRRTRLRFSVDRNGAFSN